MHTCPACGADLRDCIEAYVGDDGHELDLVDVAEPCCEVGLEYVQLFWDEILEDFDDVRRVVRDAVDYQLQLQPVTFRVARAFIEHHHGHTASLTGWKFGVAVYNGRTLLGVGVAGRPVSRVMQARGYWEITRVCVRRDLLPELSWNACSMLYGALCREIRRQGGTSVLTYVLETEAGTSVRAAGFQKVAHVPARRAGWRDGRPIAAKWRYERQVA